MTLATQPFDAADHLSDAHDQAELLADAFASGDASYIANALGIVSRARGMSGVARDAGVTREALYRSLKRDGDPKLSTLMGVIRTLGYRLTITVDTPGPQ